MAKEKKIRYIFDGLYERRYVRAFKEGRDIAVQIWNSGKLEGEPDGDWAMPSRLGLATCIAQAVLQTEKK